MSLTDTRASEERVPVDGYGAGYLVYQLTTNFHELACLIGPEAARQEVAEIIVAEFDRKARRHDRN